MSGMPPLPELTPEQAAESNLGRIMGVAGTLHVLALIFVAIRMYTRFVIVKAPKIDDAFMLLSTVGAIGGMTTFIIMSQYGLGRHRQTIADEDHAYFRRVGWIYSVTTPVIAYSILKISIACSLIRLSRSKWYSWTLWGLMGFIVAYTITAVCSFLFHCRPMAGSYDSRIKADCYPRTLFVAFSVMNTAFNMFTDVLCATLPIPIIYSLNMKLRTRIYLIGIMSLGWVTVGMGVVKAIYQIALPITPDSTFEFSIQWWGFLQFQLGIIVACAPTLRPLLGRALKLSSRDKYYGEYYGNSSRTQGRSNRRSQHPAGATFDNIDNEAGVFEMQSKKMHHTTTTVQGGHAITVYDKGERSGSEEMILQGTDGKGILRTTEIEVR
jgi:hypothetical protein